MRVSTVHYCPTSDSFIALQMNHVSAERHWNTGHLRISISVAFALYRTSHFTTTPSKISKMLHIQINISETDVKQNQKEKRSIIYERGGTGRHRRYTSLYMHKNR